MSTDKLENDLCSFTQFAESVKVVEEELALGLTSQEEVKFTPQLNYLTGKISESLTMLFRKDINDPRHWQSLLSFVSIGMANAVQAQNAKAAVSRPERGSND